MQHNPAHSHRGPNAHQNEQDDPWYEVLVVSLVEVRDNESVCRGSYSQSLGFHLTEPNLPNATWEEEDREMLLTWNPTSVRSPFGAVNMMRSAIPSKESVVTDTVLQRETGCVSKGKRKASPSTPSSHSVRLPCTFCLGSKPADDTC